MEIEKLLEDLQTELPDQARDLDELGDELLLQQKKIARLEESINDMLEMVRREGSV